jgi:arylsulfatase A-like enzyme
MNRGMAPRTALLPALALATGLALLGAPPASAGPDRRPNFVIFVVDMLRADHLGVYGYPKRTSPNLDRLAESGIVFERAYSAAPWTLPSTVSLLTGLVASEHGAGERRVDAQTRRITFPADPDVWLPTRFAAQGYATAAFHSHPYLRRGVSTIHEAFEEYYDSVGDAPSTAGASHWTPHAAEHMFLDALYPLVERWIAGHRDRPFLIYIHAIDVHGPYARVRLLDEDRPRVARMLAAGEHPFRKMPGTELYASTDQRDAHKSYLYDGHIAAVDDHLGRLHAALAAHGLADDTYLVFASDHGEGFGEHGDYWGHGRYVYDEQIRVPLVFLSHRRLRDAPRRTASHVNTVGLLPTLADLAGIALEEPHASRGFAALVGAAPARAAWRYDSVSAASLEDRFDAITLDGRYKLITDRKSGAREFYDLAADPGERAPLALQSATPEVRRRLEELVARRGALEGERRPTPSQTQALDDDAVRALEALGYLR